MAGAVGGADRPRIAIIIDDIGYRHIEDHRVLELPPAVAVAVLPESPHGKRIARLAAAQKREVLLHLPMQSLHPGQNNALLGPGALHADMTETALRRRLAASLAAVPQATGVNNHMGSLLTQQPQPMRWLMQALSCHRNLYFVDSYTTHLSVAHDIAHDHQLPSIRRDVFIDGDRQESAMRAQLARLLSIAERKGHALAIGHPLPATLELLEEFTQTLDARGIDLVSPAMLVSIPEPHAERVNPSNLTAKAR
ncbi:MAG: divergent polysaccharide deacetylase family protein [Pseudomonadota bacterium]